MLVGGILIFGDEMSKSEKLILEAFMKLKKPALISCEFDTANDYLAGYVSRFLSGERFSVDFNAFSKSEYELLNQTITKNFVVQREKTFCRMSYLRNWYATF